MYAFLSPFPAPNRLPLRTLRHRPPRCALTPPDDEVTVRFRRDTGDQTMGSFFSNAPVSPSTPRTPNERVLSQVRDTMRRLGVEPEETSPPPPKFVPIDISRVNPLNAYVGAVGAAAISYVAWEVLNFVIRFFLTHPLTNDLYVVQRLGAVVRTGLVCLFALGSGISGVTALGLFLLGVRTTAGVITGEFRKKDESTSQQQ